MVEPVLGQGYLIVYDFFEFAALGKELEDKAVGILVGDAFPGRVRMGEVTV